MSDGSEIRIADQLIFDYARGRVAYVRAQWVKGAFEPKIEQEVLASTVAFHDLVGAGSFYDHELALLFRKMQKLADDTRAAWDEFLPKFQRFVEARGKKVVIDSDGRLRLDPASRKEDADE